LHINQHNSAERKISQKNLEDMLNYSICHALQFKFKLILTDGDKVYHLLSHGRWFSPGTPAYSTTKTGRHDIAEILLKVALNTKISNQIKSTIQDGCYCQKMEISLIPYCCFIISQNELKFKDLI
jgi:hypothetical protein